MNVDPKKPAPATGSTPATVPPGMVATSEGLIPQERLYTLDKMDLAMRKKTPPTQKNGRPIQIDDYDDTLGKADPGQEIERFKADVARMTDTRVEDLDVYVEEDKLWYRIRSKGRAGEIHFKDPRDRERVLNYVSHSYSKMLIQLGQKEWTYQVGGGVTPRYNVGDGKTSVGASQSFAITKLTEAGQQISLRGLIEENGLENQSLKLMVDASDPFWGQFKDMAVTFKRTPEGTKIEFDSPSIKASDEIQDATRDRALGLLKRAFVDGDPVALAQVGAAVGVVVGAGALIYSGALDNTFVGGTTKKGIEIPIGLDMNIIKTGRQKIGIKGKPVITIGSHKLDVSMREAGLKYELNHEKFLFRADGVYRFEDETIKADANLALWGNRANIGIEHVNGLGDSSKTSSSLTAGVGGPINSHFTWHADYKGTIDGQGHYVGSALGGRIGYNTGSFQKSTSITVGAGVDGLGVSRDAISPYVSANIQKRF